MSSLVDTSDRELTIYPESLLDGIDDGPPDRRWRVLYTKARHEKAVARELLGHRIPFYLPLIKRTRRYRRNKVTSRVPLFPGYVFMYGSEQERVLGLVTNRVSRILHPPDGAQLLQDLRRIRRLIVADAPLTPEAHLVHGKRVRVRCGSLAGLEGTVLVRRGKTRLLVSVDFMQQGASIEIDDFMLDPLS